MEGTSFRSHRHSRPTFIRVRASPGEYLVRERRQLLRLLPDEHALRNRVQRGSGAIITDKSSTGIPRQPFTDEELRAIKVKRKTTAPDQNEARLHLQDTNLLNMWNTDCQTEEQWKEYDSVQQRMELSMIKSRRSPAAFDPEYVVGEKRKRVVSGEKRTVKLKADDLEDGEIEQEEEEEEEPVQTIKETNDQLKRENESIRAFLEFKGLGGALVRSREPSPPASPESERTDSSGDGSDLDDEGDDHWAKLERKRGLD